MYYVVAKFNFAPLSGSGSTGDSRDHDDSISPYESSFDEV